MTYNVFSGTSNPTQSQSQSSRSTTSENLVSKSVSNLTELNRERGTDGVQALADISRSALWCHSNETRAPTANPPNRAQLDGTAYYSPSYYRVRAAVWECGEGQTATQTAVANVHFGSATDRRFE